LYMSRSSTWHSKLGRWRAGSSPITST